MLRSLTAVTVVAAALLVPATAGATVLPTSYAHQVTHDVAKRLFRSTRDAERFGVEGCTRQDSHRIRCAGFVSGHSLDGNGASRRWRCRFSAHYTLTRQSGVDYHGLKVRGQFSNATCSGPGAQFIQRPFGRRFPPEID
jgi:hypothetical protein